MVPVSLPSFISPGSAAEAREIQNTLRGKLKLQDGFGQLETIGGVDVGYDMAQGVAKASIVTMRLSDLVPLEQVQKSTPVEFPYVPGLLSFREIPAILGAIGELITLPDAWMVDGHGFAHPRRMGIAAHLGVVLDMPSLGVAKSLLTGNFVMPGPAKGDSSPLMSKGECIGMVLRSRDNVKPLFISSGHRISLETAVKLTLQCLTRYRLPEPTRLADKLSKFV